MAVSINENLCCGDKLCINICPCECIELNGENKAVLSRKGSLTCISCGQCIAVCPKGAISLEINDNVEKGEIISGSYPSFDTLKNMIQLRRSVRQYKDSPSPNEDIEKALDIVRFAPTSKNKQYVKWVVINGKEKVRQLADLVIDFMRSIPSAKRMVASHENGEDPIFRGATCVIFAYCDKEIGERFGTIDCTIAASYLELLLPSMGIGTCWAGFAIGVARQYAPINEFLGLKDTDIVEAGLMIGYQKTKYRNIPPRKKAEIKFI